MIAEVIQRGFAKNTGDAIRIFKNDKNMIRSLDICWNEIDRIFEMGFIILKEKNNTILKGFRDSHKFVAMLVLSYAILGGLGLNKIKNAYDKYN